MLKIKIIDKHQLTGICLLLLVATGCIKKSDSPIEKSDPLQFAEGNLKKELDKIDTLSLFRKALDRIGFTPRLESSNAFTIFAVGDKAMRAEGLDEAAIQSIRLDSLNKIISYHILPGALDNGALESLPITKFIQTLRKDTISIPFQGSKIQHTYMSVQRGDKQYVNGLAFELHPQIVASNGYIYPIGKFIRELLIDESKTLWDIIVADPELSMFKESIELLDSIKQSSAYEEREVFGFDAYPDSDAPVLQARKYDPLTDKFTESVNTSVFAPTNQAFHDAGFYSIGDVRAFAFRTSYGVKFSMSDDGTQAYISFRFSSLDTLLARNVMYNKGMDGSMRYPSRIMYGDMIKGKLNNGILNRFLKLISGGFGTYVKTPSELQFSQENGIAYIQWYPGSPKIVVPKDSDPLKPVNNYSVDNGVLYKINKLFYPFK
ncbi:hypothetical protein HHL16_17165 [Pseudoflavitalea sp. G-6-1-2]|uniref:fasciclin domain-containing protein n=1 Tax=Pseudoflavitalea sp. G-6-1-2 TaxID=2728841 RepID=UPI00146AE240|nr:fasciclin domain-containing protein [Pseudoflavitalea sp. G-6-1-2]NML22616.1 hypothetical protein [Pseudoflavitalea sp. G-6-1-2]